MNYWLIALPRKRLEFCLKIGTFGLNRNHLLGKMEVGDKVACYTTDERKIVALGEVTEPYFLDDTKIFDDKAVFPDEQLYPDRIGFRAERLRSDFDFISILDKMSFVKNLANWQGYFRFAIVRLSKGDWDVIQASCSSPVNPT